MVKISTLSKFFAKYQYFLPIIIYQNRTIKIQYPCEFVFSFCIFVRFVSEMGNNLIINTKNNVYEKSMYEFYSFIGLSFYSNRFVPN